MARQNVNTSTSVLGTTVMRMHKGVAFFLFSVKPRFTRVSFRKSGRAIIPAICLFQWNRLCHSEAVINQALSLKVVEITIAKRSNVCPVGYVLNLYSSPHVLGARAGVCTLCKPGTYSVSQLKGGISDRDPSCLNCPLGGNCAWGGNHVGFDVGNWIVSSGIYKLIGCPSGYQLQ